MSAISASSELVPQPTVFSSAKGTVNLNSPIDLLVCDESASMLCGVRSAAARRGLNVIDCRSLEEALRLTSLCLPSVALIDVSWRSYQAANFLKELFGQHAQCKCVFMSASPSIAFAVKLTKLGASNYLPKSIGVDEILDIALDLKREIEIPSKPMNPERLVWEHVHRELLNNGNNISATARRLGMHRRSLQRRLNKSAPRE
jgi:two-component system response regulator RegA